MTGKELAALRRRAGFSQSALAQSIGLSRQTVSYWERRPSLDGTNPTLQKIAKGLDPAGRKQLLASRPGLGFVNLSFTAPVYAEQLNLIFIAMAIRRATLSDMRRRTCGAMTRRSMECRLRTEPGRKRCRLHGGLSTGPLTAEGKARIAEAQRKRWAERRKRAEEDEKS